MAIICPLKEVHFTSKKVNEQPEIEHYFILN
jgi:hypothetical protein